MRFTIRNSDMRTIRIMVLFFLTMLIFAGTAGGDEPVCHDLIVKADNGTINWTKGILTAVGNGMPPEAHHQNQQGKTLALRMAMEDAHQKLLSVAEQIQIDTETTVKALTQESNAVLTEIKEMVKQADVVHQEYSTDGSVTVTIQMGINGGFSQLVLPSKIKQIESIKPVRHSNEMSKNENKSDSTARGARKEDRMTGLVVDARELPFIPCLVPRIVDEFGQEVFGPAFASREFAVQRNMSGFSIDISAAAAHPRVAPHPLIVKGLKAEGGTRTSIVVSNTDAAKLKHAFQNLTFLRQCRVMIVADSKEIRKTANQPKHSIE